MWTFKPIKLKVLPEITILNFKNYFSDSPTSLLPVIQSILLMTENNSGLVC